MGPLIPSIIFGWFIVSASIISAEKWSTPILDRRSDSIFDDWVPLAGAESAAPLPRVVPIPPNDQQQQQPLQSQGQIHLIPQYQSSGIAPQSQPQLRQPQQAQHQQQAQQQPQALYQQHQIRQPFTFPYNTFNYQPQLVALTAPQFLMPSQINSSKQQDVQLVYVPVDTLRSQGRLQPTIEQQAVRQGKLQQQFLQFQNNIQQIQQQAPLRTTTLPYVSQQTITTPRPKTTLKPHQPPLSVYMGGQQVRLTDVVQVLKNAKSIAVLDHVGPESPQVFVGPSNIQPPRGYAKFELPYLNSLESNRIERKVDQLPFFVAPLSFQPPPGYSKIPFPAPHVGSVVVSNITLDRPVLHSKPEYVATVAPPPPPPPPLPTVSPIRTKRPQSPKLPTITAELPGLVNSLQDSKNNAFVITSPVPPSTHSPRFNIQEFSESLPTQSPRFNTQEFTVPPSTHSPRYNTQEYRPTTPITHRLPSTFEPELSIIPNSQSHYQSSTPPHAEVALQQPEQTSTQHVNYQQQYIQEVSVQPPPPSSSLYSLDHETSTETHLDEDYTTATLPPTSSARPFRGRQRATIGPDSLPRRNSRTRRPATKTLEEQDYQDPELTPTTPSTTANTYRSHVRSRPRTSSSAQQTQRTRQRTPGRKRVTTTTEHFDEDYYPKLPEGENYPKIAADGANYPQQSRTTTEGYGYLEQEQQSQHQVEVNNPDPTQLPQQQQIIPEIPILQYQQQSVVAQPNLYDPNSFIVDAPEPPPSTENVVIQEMQYFTSQRNKLREPEPEKIFQIEEEEPQTTPTTTTTTTTQRPHRRTRVRSRQRVNSYDENKHIPINHRRTLNPIPSTTTTTTTTTPESQTTNEEESYGFFRTPNFKGPSTDTSIYAQNSEQPYEEEEITTQSTTTQINTTPSRQPTHRRYNNNNFVSRGSSRRNSVRSTTTTTTPPPSDKVFTVRPPRRQQQQQEQTQPQTRLTGVRGRIRKPTTSTTTTTEEPVRRPQYNNEVDSEISTRRISTKFNYNVDPTTEKFRITLVDDQPYNHPEPIYQQVQQQLQQQQFIPQSDFHQIDVVEPQQYEREEEPVAIRKPSKSRVRQEYEANPEEVYQPEKLKTATHGYQTQNSPKPRVRQEHLAPEEYQPENPVYQPEYTNQKQTHRQQVNYQFPEYHQSFQQQQQPVYDLDYIISQPSPSPSSYSDGTFEDGGGQESKLSTVKIAPPTSYQNAIMATTEEILTTNDEMDSTLVNMNNEEHTTRQTLLMTTLKENETTPTVEISKDILSGVKKATDPETEKKVNSYF